MTTYSRDKADRSFELHKAGSPLYSINQLLRYITLQFTCIEKAQYVAWIKLDRPSEAIIKMVLYTAAFVKLVLYTLSAACI